MAKKKRVTLPKDFKELIETGDIEKLEAIYDLCDFLPPMMDDMV